MLGRLGVLRGGWRKPPLRCRRHRDKNSIQSAIVTTKHPTFKHSQKSHSLPLKNKLKIFLKAFKPFVL